MKKPPNNHRHHIRWPALVAAAVKLLLIPVYRSTDFEVHRHWLALTHSLPLSQWYSDTTSPWTLDYPPFFAYFEKFLSLFASRVDPTITHLHNGLNYASPLTILFQRLSVVISDVVLVYSVFRLGKNGNFSKLERFLMWVLVIWSPGLFIVDHMHFQYNGFLLGLLLLSISCLEEGRDLIGGFVFAVLLCFKHLFAVAAPVYFVYLFRHYCRGGLVKGFGRLVLMGSAVLAVFAAAYGPFLYYGQIQVVLRRMFPFGRGLCHAYWAPNFWVFYIILDKFLSFFLAKLGFDIQAPKASFTGGLVGDSSPFAVLPTVTMSSLLFYITIFFVSILVAVIVLKPTRWGISIYVPLFENFTLATRIDVWKLRARGGHRVEPPLFELEPNYTCSQVHKPITPLITFITVLLAIAPCLVKAWRNPQPRMVSRWVSYAYTCGFLFGWHVHEKASLHFVIPLAATALKSTEDAKHYFYLSIVSCYSLFPLLFEAQEYPIKVVFLLLHAVLMFFGFSSRFPGTSAATASTALKGTDNNKLETHAFHIGWFGKSYLFGLLVVEIWGQFLHPIVFGDRFPFLPLMMISIYCALGMMYSWFWQLKQITLTH